MTQKAALNFCENDLRVPAHLLEIDTGEENISLKTFAWGNISLRKKIASENTLRKHLLEIDSVQENNAAQTEMNRCGAIHVWLGITESPYIFMNMIITIISM